MLKAYFRRVFSSPLIYFCILAVTAVFLIRFLYNNDGSDVVNMIDITLDLDGMRKVILIFAAVPFNANFCIEYNSRVTNMCVLRSNIKKYVNSNLIMMIVSSFAVTFIGLWLATAILSLNKPFYIVCSDQTEPMPYGVFLKNGLPIVYSLIRIFIYSVSNSMWAVSGAAVSAIIPNSFVAICTPYIFSYIIEKITMTLPDYLNLYYLTLSRDILGTGVVITFIYTIFIFILLSAAFSYIFKEFVIRRITNEIV